MQGNYILSNTSLLRIKTPGDGNCMFYSFYLGNLLVDHGMKGLAKVESMLNEYHSAADKKKTTLYEQAIALREKVAKQVKKTYDAETFMMFRDENPTLKNPTAAFNSYLGRIRKGGSNQRGWGGEFEIVAFASLFKRKIAVYSSDRPGDPPLMYNGETSWPLISIVHVSQCHYDLIIDMSKTTDFIYVNNGKIFYPGKTNFNGIGSRDQGVAKKVKKVHWAPDSSLTTTQLIHAINTPGKNHAKKAKKADKYKSASESEQFEMNKSALNAAFSGNAVELKRLLKRGVSPNVENIAYASALEGAAYYGHEDCVKLLIDAGARLDRPNRKKKNRTALMIAALNGQLGCVKLLVKAGANTKLKDSKGYTALDLAIREDNSDIVAYLLKNT